MRWQGWGGTGGGDPRRMRLRGQAADGAGGGLERRGWRGRATDAAVTGNGWGGGAERRMRRRLETDGSNGCGGDWEWGNPDFSERRTSDGCVGTSDGFFGVDKRRMRRRRKNGGCGEDKQRGGEIACGA